MTYFIVSPSSGNVTVIVLQFIVNELISDDIPLALLIMKYELFPYINREFKPHHYASPQKKDPECKENDNIMQFTATTKTVCWSRG